MPLASMNGRKISTLSLFSKEQSEQQQLQLLFRAAVSQNDTKAVKRLLKNHRDSIWLDALNEEGLCALHQCSIDGNKKLLSILLRQGANIDAADPEGWTSLHASTAAGHISLTKYLIRHNANVMIRTEAGELPIDFATDYECIYMLGTSMMMIGEEVLANSYLQRLKNVLPRGIEKRRSISESSDESQPKSILKKFPANVLNVPKQRISLTSSSSDSDTDDWHIVERKVSRNSVTFPTTVLFHDYVQSNESENLRTLLQSSGFNEIDKLDHRGLSAIHWASMYGYSECISVLVKSGANVENTDPYGWTPLHAAAAAGHSQCIESLLQCGAKINAVTNRGETVFDIVQDDKIKLTLDQYKQNNLAQMTHV